MVTDIATWIADIERRASSCETLWKQEGAPTIDECDNPPGAGYFHAMMAFRRLAKDMREAAAVAGDKEMAFHRATTCACTAAQRYMPSCHKHGIPTP